jgi:Flp pilus assembly protein TadB
MEFTGSSSAIGSYTTTHVASDSRGDIEAKNTGKGEEMDEQTKRSRQLLPETLKGRRIFDRSGDRRPGVCAYALSAACLLLVVLAAALGGGAAPDGLQHGLLHDMLVHVLRAQHHAAMQCKELELACYI